jgi:hypothetical protein
MSTVHALAMGDAFRIPFERESSVSFPIFLFRLTTETVEKSPLPALLQCVVQRVPPRMPVGECTPNARLNLSTFGETTHSARLSRFDRRGNSHIQYRCVSPGINDLRFERRGNSHIQYSCVSPGGIDDELIQ